VEKCSCNLTTGDTYVFVWWHQSSNG